MLILLVSFSQQALTEAENLKEKWNNIYSEDAVEIVYGGKELTGMDYGVDVKGSIARYFSCDLAGQERVIVFISSCGIAVRMISPYLIHKAVDPAVLVMDEHHMHCISLLSGHLGGANKLCGQVADLMDAQPVITTASDISGAFSPDMYAKENGLGLSDFDMSKKISAAAVAGETVGIIWDKELGGYEKYPDAEYGVYVTDRECTGNLPFTDTLVLRPRSLIVGVGCKKDIEPGKVLSAVNNCFQKSALSMWSVRAIVSIDLKKDENAIITLADELDAEFVTFTAEELISIEGRYGRGYFSESDFVREVTGVGCVSEESIMAYGARELIVKKTAFDGVTVAVGRV